MHGDGLSLSLKASTDIRTSPGCPVVVVIADRRAGVATRWTAVSAFAVQSTMNRVYEECIHSLNWEATEARFASGTKAGRSSASSRPQLFASGRVGGLSWRCQ